MILHIEFDDIFFALNNGADKCDVIYGITNYYDSTNKYPSKYPKCAIIDVSGVKKI